MKLIATATVSTTGISRIELLSVPQTFTDLVVLISARTNQTGNFGVLTLRLNDSATGSFRALEGDGGSAYSYNGVFTDAFNVVGNSATANTFSNGFVYVPNYTTSVDKAYASDSVTENNATQAIQTFRAGSATSAVPVTSVIIATAHNFIVGSTASLYGITKGSDGITTAS
jgi:hypothetical protein